MRCNLRNTACRIVTIVVSVFVARTEVRADPEAEYIRNRYGFMAHYTYGWGGGHRYPGTCNPDGSTPKSLDEVADKFNAEGFAKDMVAFGVEYVIFTPHHADMNLLYPSKKMDRWRPGHAAKRDVVRDLVNALKGTGIKLYLYGHVNDGHDFSPEGRAATGFNEPAPRKKWNDFINDIYAELVDRYGQDVKGYLCDGDWTDIDVPRLKRTVLSRQPDAILVTIAPPPEGWVDFGCNQLRWPQGKRSKIENPVDDWPSYDTLSLIVQGDDWWARRSNGKSRFSPEEMFRYTVLQAGVARKAPGVAWAAGPYTGKTTWENGVKDSLLKLGAYIKPLAESIKSTYPSTSFPVSSGTTIRDLKWGAVATRSVDGRYEYVHVLNPPAGKGLRLPAPADEKKFISAELLDSGHEVTLQQDEQRVILELPDGDRWDSLDTVIKLTAVRVSAAEDTEYRWDHKPGAELALRSGKKTIWVYHFKADGGFPYVHPLATSDGTCLTALAPDDHPWHRAVWFSWKHLNGVNYWNWEGNSKQPVPPGRTVPVGKETVALEAGRARIAMNLHYTSDGRTVLKEKREIVIRVPRDDGSYRMDWRATFTAAEADVVLDRTPIPGQPGGAGHGGYAGLSFRGAASLREVHSLDSEGRRDKESHGKAARWLDYHAAIDDQGRTAGVTIFDHPHNFRHPSPWYISFGGMPYFGPAPIFHKPYTLSVGDTLTLRYRILVHPGRGNRQLLEREYKEFASSE